MRCGTPTHIEHYGLGERHENQALRTEGRQTREGGKAAMAGGGAHWSNTQVLAWLYVLKEGPGSGQPVGQHVCYSLSEGVASCCHVRIGARELKPTAVHPTGLQCHRAALSACC